MRQRAKESGRRSASPSCSRCCCEPTKSSSERTVMDRRAFVTLAAGGTLGAPFGIEAQQTRRVYRVGYLEAGSASGSTHLLAAIQQGLHELGYIEGQRIIVERRFAEGKQ